MIKRFLVLMFCCFLIVSCPHAKNDYVTSENDSNTTTSEIIIPKVSDSTSFGASEFEKINGYSNFDKTADKYSYSDIGEFNPSTTLAIDLTAMNIKVDNGAVNNIPGEESPLKICNGELAVYYTGTYGENDGQICIDGDGNKSFDGVNTKYENQNLLIELNGNTTKGLYIAVKKSCKVKIVLEEANIQSGNYPCIQNDGKALMYLEVSGTNENILKDGRQFGNGYSSAEGVDFFTSSWTGSKEGLELTQSWKKGDSSKGCVFTKGNLIILGTGTLNVANSYKHGIVSSKGYVRIAENPKIKIISSGRNGFHCANGFIMDGGEVIIEGKGEYLDNESRGIVVEGYDEEATGNDAGFIIIKDGKLNIKSVSKAITAKWKSEEDQTETGRTNSWNPNPFVLITGGDIIIETTGTPYESNQTKNIVNADGVTEPVTNPSLSPEGIEGKSGVYIFGGKIECNTTDDCINVSLTNSEIIIYDGYIYACSSQNDCIDSNGKISIYGGTIVAFITKNPECAFDCDNNDFVITGGTLIGIGTNNYSKLTASKCTQNVLVFSLGSLSKNFVIKDNSEKIVFAYNLSVNANSNLIAILSTPNLADSGKYSVVSSGNLSGGDYYHGLYLSLPADITGGSSALTDISFQNSHVYTQTGMSSGGPAEGMRPGQPMGGDGHGGKTLPNNGF